MESFNEGVAVAVGTGSGMVVKAGAWAIVSHLGTASTGTAIGTLHGAAATNATLAWFGGGAIKAGGFGIVGGTFALTTVVIAVPVAIVAGWSHSEASRIKQEHSKVQEAVISNRGTCSELRRFIDVTASVDNRIVCETEDLRDAVRKANRALHPFWFLNRIQRSFRHRRTGQYYTGSDMEIVDELDRAVNKFLAAFGSSTQDLALKP